MFQSKIKKSSYLSAGSRDLRFWPIVGLTAVLTCMAGLAIPSQAQTQYRTVIDKELGNIYQQPASVPVTDYGYVDNGGLLGYDYNAIRMLMAHVGQFAPNESLTNHMFPYAALRAYEAQQVAEGKPPIFVTATYEGKQRPVIFEFSLELKNNQPTSASDTWQYAVNVQDERFIHFWINQYAQVLLNRYQVWEGLGPDLRFHLDQGSYEYGLYGVLDDNNNFVSGVTWDSPFPQNQDEFEAAIETFFAQVKALAPNVNSVTNIGSQTNPSHFPTLFANAGGGMTEDLYEYRSSGTAYSRQAWYTNTFQYFTWLASQNRVTTLRTLIPSTDSEGLIFSFAMYSLLKGLNSFFAAGDNEDHTLNPSTWQGWAAQLGSPTGTMQASAPTSAGQGYRLYSRAFEGGTVYLNGTGTTQTIQLNPSTTYYNPSGTELTSHSVTLADLTGTYVTTQPTALLPPRITPRYGAPAMGPIPVTLESQTSGATIRYTLDGSTPTSSSPAYTAPIQVTKSEVVSARAFYGSYSSFASQASYTVSTEPLTVQLVNTSDSGMTGSYFPVVSLSAIPTSTVEVFFSVANGTPATGSYTFLPGMTYGILPITTASSGTTKVTLTRATGAQLGSNATFAYTIVN